MSTCIRTEMIFFCSADRTLVILIAQVFNGCLLPFFSTCLLLCLNDSQFMSSRPQPGWANLTLLISVLITLFLASNVVIQKIFGSLLAGNAAGLRLGIAGLVAVCAITAIVIFTSLKRDLARSLKIW